MTSHTHGLVLGLLLTITALVALLVGIGVAWLRLIDGATRPAAVLRGGAAFGATLTIAAAFLAVVWR
ncbi:hypothetical protein ABZW10_00595 [Kitasatospora sp. NPDC004723]|uniref:hypothetical protein n=1 Tax=Kitasatospora sp. NPDC004723 TaxID=3154288 RepID=UPI0033BE6D45